MKKERRFYISESHLYGLTVYDRNIQEPAFSFGAKQNMLDYEAFMLCAKLNGMIRNIDRLNFDECITLFNGLPNGSPMTDIVFDRMDSLDSKRFDKFLDGETCDLITPEEMEEK